MILAGLASGIVTWPFAECCHTPIFAWFDWRIVRWPHFSNFAFEIPSICNPQYGESIILAGTRAFQGGERHWLHVERFLGRRFAANQQNLRADTRRLTADGRAQAQERMGELCNPWSRYAHRCRTFSSSETLVFSMSEILADSDVVERAVAWRLLDLASNDGIR